jgi:hypothetical protein
MTRAAVSDPVALASFWFGRFQVFAPGPDAAPGPWRFRDQLFPPQREADARHFAALSGLPLQRAFFQYGFTPPAISSFASPVGAHPRDADDILFWQFPCKTESCAWERHADLSTPRLQGGQLHIYLGLPWATWIDCTRKRGFGSLGEIVMQQQLTTLALRLSGLRQALAEIGLQLRVHSVCQHIYWRDLLPTWQKLGLSDIWVSHCPEGQANSEIVGGADNLHKLTLHPWSLFAVNVQDPARTSGLTLGKDPAQKPVLASFIGAHAAGYLSDARLRLLDFADQSGFVVKVNGKWHFEDVVYRHQMARANLAECYVIDESVSGYNQLLSDSVFSLCPSGTGPNTLRLWESLAVGSVPVLLGPAAAMPQGGSLPPIDWERIVVRVPDADLAQLPAILRAMPMAEIRQRQQLGMAAFAQVNQQRCFQD